MVPVATTEKRKTRDEIPSSSSPVSDMKRQKIFEEEGTAAGEEQGGKVGATELASAFALASLASLSPHSKTKKTTPEARDAENGEETSSTVSLAHSPRTDPVPVSPEVNSPARGASNKRVTFAPGIKDAVRLNSRTNSFPPRINHGQGSRMPPGFARVPVLPRSPLPPQRMPANQHWMPQRHGGPPPYPMSPARNQWVCDFCNVASFPTFQEACAHEESCRARMGNNGAYPPPTRPMMNHPYGTLPNRAMGPPSHLPPRGYTRMPMHGGPTTIPLDYIETGPRGWFQGCVPLAVPETDPDWLSPLNCYMRQNCVEAFSAQEEDIDSSAKRGRVTMQQVGIRCVFCKHHHSDDRQPAAVSFPVSLGGIYESVKRWQRVHLELCDDVPEAIKSKLKSLDSENAWIPTTRQYWADSAKTLGMVDTPDGIRFAIDPSSSQRRYSLQSTVRPSLSQDSASTASVSYPEADSVGSAGTTGDGEHIVFPEDTTMVPPYVYFLIRQVECCRFTEADRFVARSKGPVGYPGFQCRHCHGHAGLGKYFPISSKSLATNSTSQNIHAHLLKCRKCPGHIKKQLLVLKEEKSKAPRLEPGWRKIFFDKIWERLHGPGAPPTQAGMVMHQPPQQQQNLVVHAPPPPPPAPQVYNNTASV